MICATGKEPDCNGTAPMPISFSQINSQSKYSQGILVVINATALLLHMFCFVKMNPSLFIFGCLSIDEVPQPSARPTSHKVVLAFGSSLGCICLLILGFGFLLWWRHKHNKQIFFDVNGNMKAIPCIRLSESIRVSFY